MKLQEDGAALANGIVLELIGLTEKLAAFDAKRILLGLEFRDLGGAAAADRLAELLFRNSGPNERLRDPNTHNRFLEDQGWVFAGKPGPSFQRIPSAVHQFGNPLQLTLQSMRRRD